MAETIIINPAQLVGKLHQAAIAKVNEKWKGKVEIVNTAIDMGDTKNPLAVIKDGEYKIICRVLKKGLFTSKKDLQKPITEYLRWFAGDDIADKMSQQMGFWKKLFGKLGGFDTRNDLEKSAETQANGLPVFTIPYKLGIQSGTAQSEEQATKQQNAQQKDNLAAQGIDTEGGTTTTASNSVPQELATKIETAAESGNIQSENSTITKAIKSDKPLDKKTLPSLIDNLVKISAKQDQMTEDEMAADLAAVQKINSETKTDVELKESLSLVKESKLSDLFGRIGDKIKTARKNKKDRKQLIKICNGKVEPQKDVDEIPALIVNYRNLMNASGNKLVDLSDTGMFGKDSDFKQYKDDEEVKTALKHYILKQFAANLHQTMVNFRKHFKNGKIKLNPPKIKKKKKETSVAAESFVSLQFPGVNQQFVFEAEAQYLKVERMINEDMKNRAHKLINAIMRGRSAKAETILEDILKRKIDKKVSEVLTSEKK